MLKFVTILTDNMDPRHIDGWGYEQTLMNYLYYYTDKLKEIGLKLELCSDRLCYHGMAEFIYEDGMVLYNSTRCPIVGFHKINLLNGGSLLNKVY